jgi:hypothetical protein
MSVEHLVTPDPDSVIAWRAGRLARTGLAPEVALRVAADPAYDLHALFELVDRGCPPALAVRIVAPLEEEPMR